MILRDLRWLAVAGLLGIVGCADDAPPTCEVTAPDALRVCVADYSAAIASCYATGDAHCAEGDAATTLALDTLEASIADRCADGELGGASVEASVGRMRNACASEASSLAWRTYGGPQGAVWQTADEADRGCLSAAHGAASGFVSESLSAIDGCLAGECDVAALGAERQTLAGQAKEKINAVCEDLGALVAVDAATFVARADKQVDCLTSTGHADVGGLDLTCGPSNAQFEAQRGEWTRVEVDGDEWGTLCGDGSPYVFHVRLAPEGERLDRMVIGLQGGGICIFEDDCTERLASSPELFSAMDDMPTETGIMSNDSAESEFANWTKVFLPYCSQDVFAGGGVLEQLGLTLEIPRHGAVNMRSAVQMVRDVVWKAMDAEGGDGFRPDEVVALFGGWSAGGYGTLYNYHWFLDDLQWPRTAAFPDAGIGLDNGETLGVRGLGLVKIPVWGTRPNLPPYCFAGECAAGEVLFNAISPRLKTVPEQQMLMVSNPLDLTQQNDAFFTDTPSFINAMRGSYCATKDLPGIHYYYTSVSSESVHVVSVRPELWTGEVDGETMRNWFAGAINDPDNVVDRAEEADFVTAIPGVNAYPCDVAP